MNEEQSSLLIGAINALTDEVARLADVMTESTADISTWGDETVRAHRVITIAD